MNGITDTNVYLSRWPFRRLPGDETPALVEKLHRHNVTQAWAGSFDGILHRDLGSVNLRLAEECRESGDGLFLPFGSVNPLLPDWEEELRRCHEDHRMPGIRLHPNYHGYTLDNPLFSKLMAAAAERGLIVQLVLSLEDERTQHPLVQVKHVDAKPLVDIVRDLPSLKLVVLNAFRALRVEQVDQLAAAGQVLFDIAMLEGVGGVARLVQQVTAERIVFGSYAPYFVFESASLKMQESALGGMQSQTILSGNAAKLLASAAK